MIRWICQGEMYECFLAFPSGWKKPPPPPTMYDVLGEKLSLWWEVEYRGITMGPPDIMHLHCHFQKSVYYVNTYQDSLLHGAT